MNYPTEIHPNDMTIEQFKDWISFMEEHELERILPNLTYQKQAIVQNILLKL